MERNSLRVQGFFHRGQAVQIEVDGEPVEAFEGESIAAALLASGRRTLRYTPDGIARGVFCGMGVCFDCVVEVDGDPSVRSCVTPVQAGMRIQTPRPFREGK
jgi:predicted molibdopterin-dependent oxidoreductase YjgC